MSDIIFIKGLKIKTYIGIHEWERSVLQSVVIDLDLHTDTKEAAALDKVEATINYRAVADRIKLFIEEKAPFNLLEALAESLAELIKKEFKVESLRLSLTKPSVFPDIVQVGVCIER